MTTTRLREIAERPEWLERLHADYYNGNGGGRDDWNGWEEEEEGDDINTAVMGEVVRVVRVVVKLIQEVIVKDILQSLIDRAEAVTIPASALRYPRAGRHSRESGNPSPFPGTRPGQRPAARARGPPVERPCWGRIAPRLRPALTQASPAHGHGTAARLSQQYQFLNA